METSAIAAGAGGRRRARATLATGGTAHFVHDGFSDGLYVLLPLWTEAFGLSLTQVGALKGLFSGALACFQVPAALLAERWGERRLLALGTLAAGLGYVVLGFAGSFLGLALCLLFIGLGTGVQHPLASSVVSSAYGSGGRRAALGIYNFTGDLGQVAVPALVAACAAAVGWRAGSMTLGVAGIVVAAFIFLALRRLGAGGVPSQPVARESVPRTIGWGPQAWGITNRPGFRVLAAISVIDSTTRTGFLTFVPFLLIAKGAPLESVGFALALIFAGGAAGKLLCGLLAERVGIIRSVVLTEIMTGGGIILLLALPLWPALALLPLVGLALNGTSSVLYGTLGDFVSPERQSRAFGLFYTLGIGAGALAPMLYGLLSDLTGVPVTLTVAGLVTFTTIPLCYSLARAMQPGTTV